MNCALFILRRYIVIQNFILNLYYLFFLQAFKKMSIMLVTIEKLISGHTDDHHGSQCVN